MRVLLKLRLDCTPDAAWLAIRRPAVFRGVAAPLMRVRSLAADGFPSVWEEGEHPVAVSLFGVVPMGGQVIVLSVGEVSTSSTRGGGPVRILRDSGRGVSGVLGMVTQWRHSMAISAHPAGGTLYRDELRFEIDSLTPLAWPFFWAFWQWRGIQLQRLAKGWTV